MVLDIADDGRGFDPVEKPGGVRGHGLPAMRVRARQLGGTLTVESTPGEGTVLSASIPLSNPHSNSLSNPHSTPPPGPPSNPLPNPLSLES